MVCEFEWNSWLFLLFRSCYNMLTIDKVWSITCWQLTKCDRSLAHVLPPYMPLRILWSHGLPAPQLHEVARAITVAFLMYASPSWWGFASSRDHDQMELLINKLKHSGFLSMSSPSASTLANEADLRLFRAVTQDPNHVLCKFLPEAKWAIYNLRPRVHEFQLPTKDNRNFIPRLLYKDIY